MSERPSSEGRGNSLGQRPSERLATRRRRFRRRIFLASTIFALLLLGAAIYGLQQRAFRVSHITVYGGDQSLAALASRAMQGNFFGVIPRDSTFFLPEARMRSLIMAMHPDIAAVSVFRNGLSGLSIKVDYRVPIARWCGDSSASSTSPFPVAAPCYLFDASGFIYATTTADAVPVNAFTVYEALATDTPPIGVTLPNASELPAAFDFARQLATFGSPVDSIVLHDSEVDDTLSSGTRIMYLLGSEQDAFSALTSARADFSLTDGSVEYIDLRFPGKIYLKRK